MPITGEHRALAEGRLPRLRAGVYGQTAAWALEGVATDTRPVYPEHEDRWQTAAEPSEVCYLTPIYSCIDHRRCGWGCGMVLI